MKLQSFGLVTVERIPKPSWLVRCRVHDEALKAPYRWVMTFTESETDAKVCEVKGYLARKGEGLTKSERELVAEIIAELGFNSWVYDRVNNEGDLKASHKGA
jgi:hypothetical protein